MFAHFSTFASENHAGPVIASVNINSCEGSITIAVTSGAAPYTYEWKDSGGTVLPSTVFVADNLAADNYTVKVTDNNGDSVTATYTVTNPPDLTASIVINNVKCRGEANAQVEVTMNNGNPPNGWVLTNSGGGTVQTGAGAGVFFTIGGLDVDTYTLVVTDLNGCTGTMNFTIIEPAFFLTASVLAQTDATCSNTSDGTLHVVGTGGWGTYTYSWVRLSDGVTISTSPSISGLAPGNYEITITDLEGCILTATYTIGSPAPVVITSSLTQVSCNGNSDGAIDASVAGGTAPYTYSWDSGETTQDITGKVAGTYTLTVTDASSCVFSASFTLTEPAVLTINENIRNVNCFGDNTGRIRSNVSGGTLPYTYLWSTGNTGRNLNNRVAGSYSVTVTDANGCTTFEAFTISEPAAALSVQATSSSLPSCFGGSDGSLGVTLTGGTAPYTYSWSDGSSNATATGLSSGNYTVTVTDANGCQLVQIYTLNDPAKIAVAPALTIPTCNGGNDGSITVVASNGTAPYTYNWNTGDVGATASNLIAGSYTVTVSDAGGCSVIETVVLGEPTVLAGNATVNDISCNGQVDGSIFLAVTGGTAPYTFTWNTGATSNNISGLTAGNYSVNITDNTGCVKVENFTIIEPAAIGVGFTQVNILCKGQATGSIDITPAGGTLPYTFLWSNGSTTEDQIGLAAGNYSVTVRDASNCAVVQNVTITEPALVLNVTDVISNINCNAGTNGSINVTVTGGAAPYNYSWNNGSISEDLTNIAAGNYSLQVTDANGCVKVFAYTVTEPLALTLTTSKSDISCNGANDGAITITPNGGTAPFSYLWNDGNTTSARTALSPANYTVTVTDANGCQNVQNFTITEPLTLTNTVTKQDVLCFGQATGIINISPSGGTLPYTFLWSNGATSEDLNNIVAGNYSVTITDANGCQLIENRTILEPAAALSFTDNVGQITCNGATDGAIALTVTGGQSPYSYNWSNGSTTQDLSGLSPGPYSVTITDANGCTISSNYTIIDPPVLTSSGIISDVTCFGASDGAIDFTVVGGQGPYTFIWSHGANTEDVTGLPPGNFTVQVVDNLGCSISEAFTITGPAALSASHTNVDIDCFGNNNGSIDLSVFGGTAPYSYSWSNGATTEDISTLVANTYTVTITDANGCQLIRPVAISQPSGPLAIAETVSDIACFGANNGSVELVVTGGTAPYTYSWDNGATTKDIFGLLVGNYSVDITDANGCTVSGVYTINSPAAIQLNSSIQNLSCYNSGDGAIDITIVGGVAPYTFLWSDGSTSEDLNAIAAGNYQVLLTDANGCTLSRSFTVTEPLSILATATIANVDCFGTGNGSVDLIVSGGQAPYTYLWSNGAVTQDVFNVSGGNYSVTITDANGCQLVQNYVVNEPAAALSVNGSVTDVTCFGSSTGVIDITVAGGTMPYTYSWSQGATTQDIAGLSSGAYQVTITDANGCSINQAFNVLSPDQLTSSIVNSNVSCNGGADGALDLTIIGGTAPYTYLWSTGSTTEDINILSIGNYSVTITDANGCAIVRNYTVTEPLQLLATKFTTDVDCFGSNDGAIDINVTGGVAPYSYLWSNGAITEDISNVSGGNYSVTITDANGCQLIENSVVNEPLAALSLVSGVTNVTCFGSSNGVIDITLAGGTAPYSYAWSNGAVTEDIAGLIPGAYQVTITDTKGCSINQTFTVLGPDQLTTTVVTTNVSCNGAADGALDLTIAGGTAPYSFIWSDGSITEDVSNLSGGSYQVLVVDANGCSVNQILTVNEPATLTLNYAKSDVQCFAGNNGAIDINIAGGTFPFAYTWSNGSTTEDLSDLVAGTYSVLVSDANGCTVTENITIQQPIAALTSTAVLNNESCNGLSDGNIDLTVNGGVAPYTYVWNNGKTNEDILGLSPGTYLVTITDANGCFIQSAYDITGPSPLILNGTHQDLSCYQSNDGQIDITLAGGTAPYTYNWSNGSVSEDLSGLTTGNYSVTAIDANGCTITKSFIINQPLPLISTAQLTEVSCFGDTNGSINLTVTGGTGPYTYSWSSGQSTQDLNGLTGGTYTVTIVDNKGCTITQDISLAAPAAALSVSENIIDANCNGQLSGGIELTVSGGTAPYNYQWSNGSNQKNLVNVDAGVYELLVIDQKGCSINATYEVKQPVTIEAVFEVESSTCLGDSDGHIITTVSGGVAPYTYVWNNGLTSKDLYSLTGGTYNVTITDINGCSVNKEVKVEDSRNLKAEVIKNNVLCKGDTSGSILLDITGGSGNYTYQWSNGETTQNLNGLAAGVYSVTITDTGGCATTANVVISEPSLALSVQLSQTDYLACYGEDTGSASVLATGGVAPYTYLWSTGARTSGIQNLKAGFYSVAITDNNGCFIQRDFSITQPANPIQIVVTGNTDLRCNGQNDGSIKIDVEGGSAPYTYLWSTGSLGNEIDNLVAGDYTIRVKDTNGCVVEKIISVVEPEVLRIVNVNINQSKCYDERNGAIELEIEGGTKPYLYQWSSGATTKNLIGITSGDYQLTVTDARGCEISASYTLLDPALFKMNPELLHITCVGANDGLISLNIEGGFGEKIIRWNTGASTETIRDLAPGDYNVVVTDENGCSIQQDFIIIEPLELTLDAYVEDAIRCGDPQSGKISMIVSGGTGPYRYRWSNGETTSTIEELLPGTYVVTVTDRNGCQTKGTYSVQQPEPLQIGLSTYVVVDCETRQVTSRVLADVTGGTGNYTYQWNSGISLLANEVELAEPARITLIIYDGLGCSQTRSIDVRIPDLAKADFMYQSEAIERDGDLAANEEVNFFDQSIGEAIDWSWDFGDGFTSNEVDPIHTFDAPGVFEVVLTIQDASGCSSQKIQTLEITEGYKVMFPTAFTPNNDGNNDFFRPKLEGFRKAQMNVYNTWGEVIFSTDDLDTKGWDGTIRGQMAENGNYIFKVLGESHNGLFVVKEGIFALIN